jgi:hypothetical protein
MIDGYVKKVCKVCFQELDIDKFPLKKSKGNWYYLRTCIVCQKQIEANHKQDLYKKNSQEIKARNKSYYEENKEKILSQRKIFYIENKHSILSSNINYAKKHRNERREYEKHRRVNKKDTINHVKSIYETQKRKDNTSYKLRKNISRLVNFYLHKVGSSKDNKSVLDFLPYSIDELKEHLEKQFESWMTWSNYGMYHISIWDDNDSTTWKWNIDHIIPQSKLPYTSMEDENFKKCWALENLRPLSAKTNLLLGNKK